MSISALRFSGAQLVEMKYKDGRTDHIRNGAHSGKVDAATNQRLQELTSEHAGDPKYFAAAFPVDWQHRIIVDGKDLEELGGHAILAATQLHGFWASLSRSQRQRKSPFHRDVERKASQVPPAQLPKTFNFATVGARGAHPSPSTPIIRTIQYALNGLGYFQDRKPVPEKFTYPTLEVEV
jgi:hypothetical protein